MIKDVYPHNRMQEVLQKRWRGFCIFIAILIVFFGVMISTPANADGSNIYQNGLPDFPGYPESALPFTHDGCTTEGACPNFAWFRCTVIGTGSVISSYPCVWVDNAAGTFVRNARNGTEVSGGLNTFVDGCADNDEMAMGQADQALAVWYNDHWVYNTHTVGFCLRKDNGGAINNGEIPDIYLSDMFLASSTDVTSAFFTNDYGDDYFIDGVPLGTVNPNSLIYGANLDDYVPGTGLFADPVFESTPTDVDFTLRWLDVPLDQIKTIIFTPTIGRDGLGPCIDDCDKIDVIYDSTIEELSSASGELLFTQRYSFSGSFTPFVILRDCSQAERLLDPESCEDYIIQGEFSVQGPTDRDDLYDFSFVFPYESAREPHQPNTYTWDLDDTLCGSGETIVENRIFKGYPEEIAYIDAGEELSGDSGTGTIAWSRPSTDFGVLYYPYLRLECSDGHYEYIYNESTLYKERATGLFVRLSNFDNYANIGYGQKGGYSSDFVTTTGSGAYFFTDKDIYQRNEPVTVTYYYDVQFPLGTVLFYPDIEQFPTTFATLSDNSDRKEYRLTTSYANSGKYYPMIEVRSTSYSAGDPSTYRRIWLGGNQTKNPSSYLEITSGIFNANNFQSTSGVFGLNPNTFRVSFGNSGNPFIAFAETVVNQTVRAGLYVASFFFQLLEQAPFFSFFHELAVPEDGKVYKIPTTFATQALPSELAGLTFQIQYATSEDSATLLLFLRLIVAFSIMFIFVRRFF